MEMQPCSQCGVPIFPTPDGLCPTCSQSKHNHSQSSQADVDSGDSASTNPYSAPVSLPGVNRACLMSKLPQRCPSCEHTFNLKYYPRRYQKKTMLFIGGAFFVASIPGVVLGSFIPFGFWLGFIPTWLAIAGPALRFSKVVHLKCRSCHWACRYLVRNP